MNEFEKTMLSMMGDLTTKVDGLSTGFANLSTKVDGLSTDFSNLSTKVDGLSTDFSNLSTKVDNLAKVQAEHTVEIKGLKEEVKGLGGEVKGFGGEVKGLKEEVSYVKMRAENVSESVAVIEVEHGQKIGVLFDMASRIQDDAKETNAIVKVMHEKQQHQELSIKWIDSRLQQAV